MTSNPETIACPQCGSTSLYKDGLRYLANGQTTQRWLCRKCGYRFTNPNHKRHIQWKNPPLNLNLQDCSDNNCRGNNEPSWGDSTALGRAVQTLATVEKEEGEKRAAGAAETNQGQPMQQEGDVKGKLIQFAWWMKKEGYSESTIIGKMQILHRLAKLGANLLQPDAVKDIIANQNWSPGRKANAVYAYALFAKWLGIPWTPPRIKVPEKLPFIPATEELNDLIAGCTNHVAVALQIAMETGARIGEIFQLKWTDVDLQKGTIIITPEKGSNPRIFKISQKLRQMLENLPKDGERILSRYSNIKSLRRTFEKQRRRIAFKLGNPRLLKISFHTFRHWKATWEYYKTKDILHVMQILGHKRIQNTLKYTQLAKFEGEEQYICKVAKTPKEIAELIEAGFSYVCEKDGYLFFKKPK